MMVAPDFPQIQDRNARANLCKKLFLSSNHQNRQWSCRNEKLFCVMRTKPTTPSN